ncbi:MAG: PEGA domain-containing protein [Polyangia bacterium]|jgi:hypothetical protein|nr:PEGA domain-containing protein [Polyangia bacterium]
MYEHNLAVSSGWRFLAVTSVLAAGLAAGGWGCATVANGTKPRIQVESHPEQARVIVNGHVAGMTPLAMVLSRKHSHQVELQYADGQKFEILFERRISGWFFANLALGLASGGIGMLVDALTGAMWSLVPKDLTHFGRMLLYEGNDRLFLRVYRCAPAGAGYVAGPGPDGRCPNLRGAATPASQPAFPPAAPPEEPPPAPPVPPSPSLPPPPSPPTGGEGG